MSVTFWCPDAPTKPTIPYPEQDPTFVWHVSDMPEVQLSNFNARASVEMMGLPESDELLGSLEVSQLEAVIERLKRILVTPEERASFLEPTTVNGQVVSLTETPKAATPAGTVTLAQLLSNRLAQAVTAGATPQEEERAAVLDMLLPADQDVERAWADQRRGPRILSFGRDDAYLRVQSERFLHLFTQAKEHNYRVCWG